MRRLFAQLLMSVSLVACASAPAPPNALGQPSASPNAPQPSASTCRVAALEDARCWIASPPAPDDHLRNGLEDLHRKLDLAYLSRLPSRQASGDRKEGHERWKTAIERSRVVVDANRTLLGILPTETLHYEHHPLYCYRDGDEDFLTQIIVSNEARGILGTVWVGNDSLPRRIYIRPPPPPEMGSRAD